MNNSGFSKLIVSPTVRGTALRVGLLMLIMLLALAISFMVRAIIGLEFSTGAMLVTFLIVLTGTVLGSIFAEYPSGDELALARVGLATFCRIGLPLVAVLVINSYPEPTFVNTAIAHLAAFYLVGLLAGVLLSLFRYSQPINSTPADELDSSEVDRAAV